MMACSPNISTMHQSNKSINAILLVTWQSDKYNVSLPFVAGVGNLHEKRGNLHGGFLLQSILNLTLAKVKSKGNSFSR